MPFQYKQLHSWRTFSMLISIETSTQLVFLVLSSFFAAVCFQCMRSETEANFPPRLLAILVNFNWHFCRNPVIVRGLIRRRTHST